MPSYDETISHHAVTQGSCETASGVRLSCCCIPHSAAPGTSDLPFIKVQLPDDFWLDTANAARRFPGKSMAAIEEVIMENTEEWEIAEGSNTYPTSWRCTGDVIPIWVSHPTTCFSGFKLSKLLAAANKSMLLLEACTAPCREGPKVKRTGGMGRTQTYWSNALAMNKKQVASNATHVVQSPLHGSVTFLCATHG